MGRASLEPDAALWLPDSNGIHMMFMRFPIDAIFVGRPDPSAAAGGPWCPSIARCGAWTGLVPLVRGAHGVLELPIGTVDAPAPRSATSSRSCRTRARRGAVRGRIAPVHGRHEPRCSGGRHHRTVLGRLVARSLDIAFPATCAGCGREGDPICAACRAGARRPSRAAGRASRSASRPISRPACCRSSGARRSAASCGRALHQLKYAGERRLARPLGEAIARRWAAVGAGGDILVPGPGPSRPRRASAATTRPSSSPRPRRPRWACRRRRSSTRRRATVAQYHLDRRDRAANVAGAFAMPIRAAARPSAAAGSCSSTTS